MRRTLVVLVVALSSVALSAGSALAMQPPAEQAAERFGCVDGDDNAIAGHPGAAGLVDATPLVASLTGDSMPTAWNAVQHADPIKLGGC